MVSLAERDLGRLPVGWTKLRSDRTGGRSPVACGDRVAAWLSAQRARWPWV